EAFAMKTSSTSRAGAQQGLVRNILVPIDFSDRSRAGLRYAVRFAKEVGARIILLHVADLGPVMMTTGGASTIHRLISKQRGADLGIRCRLAGSMSISMAFRSKRLPSPDTARPPFPKLPQRKGLI